MNCCDVLRLTAGTGNPRNSEGAFLRLRSGRLIYIFSRYCGESWEDDAPSDLALRYSDDGGQSWSSHDRIVLRHGEALNLMSVSLLAGRDGRVLVFFLRKTRAADGRVDCLPEVAEFDEETMACRNQKSLIPGAIGYYVLNNDRVIRLAGGRIIIPVACHPALPDSPGHRRDSHVIVLYSDDDAETFQLSPGQLYAPVATPNGLQEPGIVELNDGRLWCFCRTDLGCQYGAYSLDQAQSWSAVEPTPFLSPLSPMTMKRNPFTGVLIAVWNDLSNRWGMPPKRWVAPGWGEGGSGGRTPLVWAESDDDGRTWPRHRLLESDPESGFCYTALYFLPDCTLLGYCCGGRNDKNLLQESKLCRI